ncbi:MAG: hypothetical protein AB3N20_18640 [Rhizobiaceae bacterium]
MGNPPDKLDTQALSVAPVLPAFIGLVAETDDKLELLGQNLIGTDAQFRAQLADVADTADGFRQVITAQDFSVNVHWLPVQTPAFAFFFVFHVPALFYPAFWLPQSC